MSESHALPAHRLPDMIGIQVSGDAKDGCGICSFGLIIVTPFDLGAHPTAYACICDRGKAKEGALRIASIETVITAEERAQYWPEGAPTASRDRVAQLMVDARVPPKFLPWSMKSYAERFKGDKEIKRYLKLAAEWIALPNVDRSDLIFYGPNGTGKTGLAIGILRAISEQYQTSLFWTMRELSIAWRDTYRQKDGEAQGSEQDFLQALVDPALLVLDEVSGQRMSEFVEDTVTMIVDARQKRQRPTILTLNLPAETNSALAMEEEKILGELLGPTLHDRLRERGQFWTLKGQSRRETFRRRQEPTP
jgi:DNA replication protein DnaC